MCTYILISINRTTEHQFIQEKFGKAASKEIRSELK